MEPYVEFEIELYKISLRSGASEGFHLLPVNELPRRPDFWLFDDEVAYLQEYALDGMFRGGDLIDDPSTIVQLIEFKNQLLANATRLTAL